MGINLKDYVENVCELLTLEEADKLLIASGYTPIEDNENTEVKASKKMHTKYGGYEAGIVHPVLHKLTSGKSHHLLNHTLDILRRSLVENV